MFNLSYLRNSEEIFSSISRFCNKFLTQDNKIALGLILATKIEKFLRTSEKDLLKFICNFLRNIQYFCENFWQIMVDESTDFSILGRFGKITRELGKYPLYFLSYFSEDIKNFLSGSLSIHLAEKLSIPDKTIIDAIKNLPKEIVDRIDFQSIPLFKKLAVGAIVFVITNKIIGLIVKPILSKLPRKTDMLHHKSSTQEERGRDLMIEIDYEDKMREEKRKNPFGKLATDNSTDYSSSISINRQLS